MLSKYTFVPCSVCLGTARNPEAPVAIVDDDGTCLACCDPSRPGYAARPGHVLAAQVDEGSAAHVLGTMDILDVLRPCLACTPLPEQPATCPMCGDRRHRRFAGLPGRVWVPLADLAAYVQLERGAFGSPPIHRDSGLKSR